MLFKSITFLFLSMFMLFANASPALQEKREFCQVVGGNAVAGAQARQQLNMPADEFQARALEYYMNLLMQQEMGVFTEKQVEMLIEAVLNGWNSPVGPEAIGQKEFESCMNKDEI